MLAAISEVCVLLGAGFAVAALFLAWLWQELFG